MNEFYIRFGKRVFDLVIAFSALIVLSPILLLASVLVKLDSPGPIFFLQERLGKKGAVFTVCKFRTMFDRYRKPAGEIGAGHPEVTVVGRWLRRYKIDELPQILNVVKGDMSIVGPRPGLPDQLAEYTDVARQRLLVRPGLTGLAQVSGNIHLSWEERWLYDAEYVNTLSFSLDIRIILHTILVVICGEARFLKPPDHLCKER